ncbi:hypothetical protein [Thiomonas sp.]|jgi:hypothetical protein|uniref:hypothetical protein n=1 Tax=Thiomonas sp. TaxID=2047785 RepID=UPI00258EAEF9|nr:hypothetical protein [Thiomonas sp.]
MALKDIEPEGFDDGMRAYALMTRPGRMYTQGFALRECGVWLSVDGTETMIGYGDPDTALAEAEAWVEERLAKVRREIAERKRCMPSNAELRGRPLADGPA